jgi:hypothetical protein
MRGWSERIVYSDLGCYRLPVRLIDNFASTAANGRFDATARDPTRRA